MKARIEPCPWCNVPTTCAMQSRRYFVTCHQCGASGPGRSTKRAAIKAWNGEIAPAELNLKLLRRIEDNEYLVRLDFTGHPDLARYAAEVWANRNAPPAPAP